MLDFMKIRSTFELLHEDRQAEAKPTHAVFVTLGCGINPAHTHTHKISKIYILCRVLFFGAFA